MGLPLIQDEELYPGDLVKLKYEVRDTVNFLEAAAISRVKAEIAKDPRVHYQGSSIEDVPDEMGYTRRILTIYVQVADPSKVTGSHPAGSVDGADLYEVTGGKVGMETASLGAALVVSSVLVLIAAAIVGTAIMYVTYEIERIRTDPNLGPEEKRSLAEAVGKGILGSGLSDLGKGLAAMAIVLAVLWGLSFLGSGRGNP